MRVFTTGARGFLGRYIVAALLQSGHEVVALSRRDPSRPGPARLRWVQGDLATSDLRPLIEGTQAVIHAAAIMDHSGDDGSPNVNIEGTQRLLDAASRVGARRFIHVSTCLADADSPDWYARSKGLGEACVSASPLDWTILRPTEIYGEGSAWFGFMISSLSNRRLLFACSDIGGIAPVYVGDVASAAVRTLILPSSHRKSYDLPGHEMNLVEFYERLRETGRAHYRILPMTRAQLELLISLSRLFPSIRKKAESLLQLARERTVRYDSSPAARDFAYSPYRYPEQPPCGLVEAIPKP